MPPSGRPTTDGSSNSDSGTMGTPGTGGTSNEEGMIEGKSSVTERACSS